MWWHRVIPDVSEILIMNQNKNKNRRLTFIASCLVVTVNPDYVAQEIVRTTVQNDPRLVNDIGFLALAKTTGIDDPMIARAYESLPKTSGERKRIEHVMDYMARATFDNSPSAAFWGCLYNASTASNPTLSGMHLDQVQRQIFGDEEPGQSVLLNWQVISQLLQAMVDTEVPLSQDGSRFRTAADSAYIQLSKTGTAETRAMKALIATAICGGFDENKPELRKTDDGQHSRTPAQQVEHIFALLRVENAQTDKVPAFTREAIAKCDKLLLTQDGEYANGRSQISSSAPHAPQATPRGTTTQDARRS